MKVDWGADDFEWRDTSLDERLAIEWLENERLWRNRPTCSKGVPAGYDLDLEGWALQLVMGDLDPERAWRLVMTLVQHASDEQDLSNIGIGPPESLLRNHAEITSRVRAAAETDLRLSKP